MPHCRVFSVEMKMWVCAPFHWCDSNNSYCLLAVGVAVDEKEVKGRWAERTGELFPSEHWTTVLCGRKYVYTRGQLSIRAGMEIWHSLSLIAVTCGSDLGSDVCMFVFYCLTLWLQKREFGRVESVSGLCQRPQGSRFPLQPREGEN